MSTSMPMAASSGRSRVVAITGVGRTSHAADSRGVLGRAVCRPPAASARPLPAQRRCRLWADGHFDLGGALPVNMLAVTTIESAHPLGLTRGGAR